MTKTDNFRGKFDEILVFPILATVSENKFVKKIHLPKIRCKVDNVIITIVTQDIGGKVIPMPMVYCR